MWVLADLTPVLWEVCSELHSGWQTQCPVLCAWVSDSSELTLFAVHRELFDPVSFQSASLSGLDITYMEQKRAPLMFDAFQSDPISLRSYGGENLSPVSSQH